MGCLCLSTSHLQLHPREGAIANDVTIDVIDKQQQVKVGPRGWWITADLLAK